MILRRSLMEVKKISCNAGTSCFLLFALVSMIAPALIHRLLLVCRGSGETGVDPVVPGEVRGLRGLFLGPTASDRVFSFAASVSAAS